jgi:hypothetical protein
MDMSMASESSRSGRAPCSIDLRCLMLLAALGGSVVGCNAAGAGPIAIAGGPSSLGGSSGAGGASTGPDDEPPPIFSDPPPPPPGPPDTCDKVDFLYVVDNSNSMLFEQQKLAQSFIGFSRIVDDVLSANDHQIMVVDTDAFNGSDSLITSGQPEEDPCIGVLGAGLRIGSEGQSCEIEGSQHFMPDQQPDAAGVFSCLANVGILGLSDEQPAAALLAATGATSSDAEACNAGFMRDDAVLVVTIITDEEDEETPGNPEDWKRALLDVKGGNEAGIVMLGLISDVNDDGTRAPDGLCDPRSGAVPAPRLREFVTSFERGSVGSICAPDYAQFFADAVSVIDTSCRDFVPLR